MKAAEIADKIVEDLANHSGLRESWLSIDSEEQDEIRDGWAEIIEQATRPATALSAPKSAREWRLESRSDKSEVWTFQYMNGVLVKTLHWELKDVLPSMSVVFIPFPR